MGYHRGMRADEAIGMLLLATGAIAMLGANLANLPSLLHRRHYDYARTAAWGGAGFAVFIAGMIVSASWLPLWVLVLSLAFWLRGLAYVFMGLRWLSGAYSRK